MKKRINLLMIASILSQGLLLPANAARYTTINEGEELTVENQTYKEYSTGSGGSGGVIYNKKGSFTATGTNLFDLNTASTGGGAIYNYGATAITNVTASFINNKANSSKSGGGAIYNYKGMLTVNEGSSFTKNSTTGKGGAIFNTGVAIINATFENNSSTSTSYGGGAIYNEGTLTINDGSSFTKNTAQKYGGAIYNDGTAIINADFDSNTSKSYGGAIYSIGKLEVTGEFQNNSGTSGGAIYSTASTIIGENSKFTENKATNGYGGAIYGKSNTIIINDNVEFASNIASGHGGAVYGNASKINIYDNVKFISNETKGNGGAIHSGTSKLEIGQNAIFTDNKATSIDSMGGAIYNRATSFIIGDNSTFTNNSAVYGGAIMQSANAELSLNEATFDSNQAVGNELNSGFGGAIAIGVDSTKDITITNSKFINNSSTNAAGAIGQLDGSTSSIIITDSNFTNNTTVSEGGAIVSDSILKVANTIFDGNKTTGTDTSDTTDRNEGGGAIFLYDESKATITDSIFINNSSGTYGGAIASRTGASSENSSLEIISSDFENNSSASDGGAIATTVNSVITDTSFTNNSAAGNGGAIYSNANVTINALNEDVVFSGNTASDGGDIYMATADTNLSIVTADDTTVTLASGVSGNESGFTTSVSGTGTLDIQSYINNTAITVASGSTLWLNEGSSIGTGTTVTMNDGSSLNTINNSIDTFGEELTMIGNVQLSVDINSDGNKADNFANANTENTETITIENINSINSNSSTQVKNFNIFEALGLDSTKTSIAESVQTSNLNLLTLDPIRYMRGTLDPTTGNITYAPTGNSYNDFNPAVVASSVAAQMGGYLTQLNSYDEAFRNMDMYMLMTKSQRQAMKNANKYATADSNLVFDPINTPYTDKAGWFRPYATFESVGLKNGPKVDNTAYGTYAGLESEMVELGHGWDGMMSIYAGYNGSHQKYQGNSIYQNGGTLGLVGMAYKDNFFTGLTANVGSSIADASTMYGSEDFTMLMTGIASKTGYNWELADGKFIIQPNYMMSYSMVNTFDYTNAAGVRINSDPLHAIHIEPGVKFIGNLKNGWQPYAGVSVVMNIMDDTKFKANDVSLPELSVKPYAKYGVGVRKTWGERFTGFFQTFITSGGRNGVGLQGGFRWTLGKSKSNDSKANSTGEKKYIKAKV